MSDQDQLYEWRKLAEEARQAVLRVQQLEFSNKLPAAARRGIGFAYGGIVDAIESVDRRAARRVAWIARMAACGQLRAAFQLQFDNSTAGPPRPSMTMMGNHGVAFAHRRLVPPV